MNKSETKSHNHSSNKVCEIKSVREEAINNVISSLKENEEYGSISEIFKILGDYNRIRIINAINIEELCVCELSLVLDMSQSAISHQLRTLRANKIVKFRRENKKVYYSINNAKIIDIINKGLDYSE
ncbi:MAG: ArsR/SmtB family transcription factor [Methanobacteriaceae archaeon]